MKTRLVEGSAVWRLPGEQEIHMLHSGPGADMFLLSNFDKSLEVTSLKGNIMHIEAEDLQSFFAGWDISNAENIASTHKNDYIEWVEKAKKQLINGVLNKVVLAQRQWFETSTDIYHVFEDLRASHPYAFVFAFCLKNNVIMLGASPESLLRRSDNMLYTEALGGTRTREKYTEKEVLEHQHISSYIEEILLSKNYIFEKGDTVTKPAGQVEHLLTPFKLQSNGIKEDMGLALALHPTSAVCGLPYGAAMDFILKTEDFDRRFYSGFLGPVHSSGDFNLFVNLRCAEFYANGILLYAGAGLNSMSDAEDEWNETLQKMQTVLRSVK